MEKIEAKLAERGAEVAPPKLVKDIIEFPAVRIVPTHTLKAVWRYFREFPHDMFPVFKNAFVDVVEGVVYPQSILLLKDRSDDRRVGDIVNNAVFVQADASVEDLYKLLKERKAPGAVVVDKDGKYLGIATLRGLLEAVRHMKPKARSVNAVYSAFGESVVLAKEGDPVDKPAKKLAGGEIEGAVVANVNGVVSGVLTVWDFVKSSIWLRPRREPRPLFGKGASRGSSEGSQQLNVRALESTGVPAASPRTSVEDVANAMASLGVYVLPVVDKDGRPVGAVTAWDVLRAYFEGPKEGREDVEPERPISEAVEARPREAAAKPVKFATGIRARELVRTDIPTVGLLDSVSHVRRVMVRTGAPVVAVANEDGNTVGFISRRDLLFYLAERSLGYWKVQKGKRLVLKESVMPGEQAKVLREEGTASELMKVDVPKLAADASAEEIAYAMLSSGLDYVLVVGGSGEPLGIVTRDDLVKAYADRGREDATVAELMTPADIAVVNPMHSVSHVVEVMKKYELDGVLVAEGGDIKGAVVDNKLSLTPIEESLRGERVFVVTKSGSRREGSGRLRYPKAGTLTALDIADDPPPSVPPTLKSKEAARLLLQHGVLAVLDQQGRLVGVLTGFDIVRDLARSYVAFKSETAKKVEEKA
ncbi:CBS domain containing membrane protein [Thermoproteus uzoniensis 768-20]|uniref:CBS domain containing membrane protein n=1 Tax=Thermoproteus uzoniensis (strain 768-20) TaxID=999630 RepID=F2L411_THEU7|nr:CBS domain-containing protein [Thermoproteus uzoniensis]AEA13323.1 CBS domain containing membrane protein [Thermoproteus uzoniensis 768-20]